jgi:hypothetical protein
MAMTSINISSIFESSQFWEIAVETFERMSEEYIKLVDEKIFSIHRKEGRRSGYDFDDIRKMNSNENYRTGKIEKSKNVFNIETLDQIEKIKNKFFKS